MRISSGAPSVKGGSDIIAVKKERAKVLALTEPLGAGRPLSLLPARGEGVTLPLPGDSCMDIGFWRSLIILGDQPLPFVTRPSLSGDVAINIWGWEVTHAFSS